VSPALLVTQAVGAMWTEHWIREVSTQFTVLGLGAPKQKRSLDLDDCEGGGLALGFDRMNAHLICTFWLNTFEQKPPPISSPRHGAQTEPKTKKK
jgi:hypothetical protein